MGKIIEHLEEATIRFAGDSGDGMQLVGTQFSDTRGFAGCAGGDECIFVEGEQSQLENRWCNLGEHRGL